VIDAMNQWINYIYQIMQGMQPGVYGSTTPAKMWQYRDLGYTYA